MDGSPSCALRFAFITAESTGEQDVRSHLSLWSRTQAKRPERPRLKLVTIQYVYAVD
jgi:hypothetical protein